MISDRSRAVRFGAAQLPVQHVHANANHPIVSTLFANAVLKVLNGADAGPLTTRPLVVNREPWQGQTKSAPSNPVIVHVWCVQVEVRAVNV